MANYATLIAAIQSVITTNGNNEITGALLQQSLLSIINSLGADYQFAGVAVPETTPGTPDQRIFYICGPGTYPNFNSAVISEGNIGIFLYNGAWTVATIPAGKNYDDQFGINIQTKQGYYNTNSATTSGAINTSNTIHGLFMACKPGDIFIIYGKGATSNYYRLWALYDSEKNRIDRFTGSGNYRTTPYTLTVPNGAAYIIINLNDYDSATDKIVRKTSFTEVWNEIIKVNEETDKLKDRTIHLVKFGSDFVLNVGEYGYKTTTKEIRYNAGDEGIITVPFYDGAIYRYGSELYYWDSTNENMQVFFPEIAQLEQSVLDISGSVGSNKTTVVEGSLLTTGSSIGKPPSTLYTNRARTNEFLIAPFTLTVPNGYKVFAVFQYEKDAILDTTTSVAVSQLSSHNVKSVERHDQNYKYRVVISKEDTTADVDISVLNAGIVYKSGLFVDSDVEQYGKYYINNEKIIQYTNYSALIAAYDELVAQYPNSITKTQLGVDVQNTPIYEYVISEPKYNTSGRRGTLDDEIGKPIIAIMAGVHGYERNAVNSLFYIVKDILNGVAALSTILGNCVLRIIPCVCPYGFTNNSRTNYNGVNINRNFDSGWYEHGAGTNDYSGPSAASELETQIAQTWLQTVHDAGALLAIDWHNSGYSEEISCFFSKNNEPQNMLTLKKDYLFNSCALASILINKYSAQETDIWGYTCTGTGAGYSNNYMDKIGQCGCIIETSNNVDGIGTYTISSSSAGATVIGNVLIGWCEKFKLQ